MPVAVKMTVQGLEGLGKALARIDRKIAGQIVRTATREAAKIIRDEAQLKAPVRSGTLKRAIKVRAASKMKRGSIGIVVTSGESGKKADNTGDAFYGYFLEYGYWKVPFIRNSAGEIRSVSRARAKIMGKTWQNPRPFMRPAFDAKVDQAVTTVTNRIRGAIDSLGM
jgi:HK97 gp10 family phage protein